MARFQKTKLISHVQELNSIQSGQWIAFDSGQRGQYLGKTEHGTLIVRYQHDKFGQRKDWHGNKLLRQYAKENGSK